MIKCHQAAKITTTADPTAAVAPRGTDVAVRNILAIRTDIPLTL